MTAGALPASVTACDGYVLTGSPAGKYEDLPWIPGLIRFLRNARGKRDWSDFALGTRQWRRHLVAKSSSGPEAGALG